MLYEGHVMCTLGVDVIKLHRSPQPCSNGRSSLAGTLRGNSNNMAPKMAAQGKADGSCNSAMPPNSATMVKQKYLGKEAVREDQRLSCPGRLKGSWASLVSQCGRLARRRVSIAGVAVCTCTGCKKTIPPTTPLKPPQGLHTPAARAI